MKIGFIGAGNVGFTLAKYLNLKYQNVVGFYSRDINDAKEASKFVLCEYYNDILELSKCCDTLFLTVNDDSLVEISKTLKNLNIKNKIIIHTSGSNSSEILNELCDNYLYSLHPLYAFANKYEDFKKLDDIYFTLEGNNKYINDLKSLFNNTYIIDTKDKALYHAYAVFASNLVNALINISYEGFKKLNINPNALMPLFINNALNIKNLGPKVSLTGPVKRCDLTTINKHLEVLPKDERDIYIKLSKILVNMTNNNEILKELEKDEKECIWFNEYEE